MKLIKDWATVFITITVIGGGVVFGYGSLNSRVKAAEIQITEMREEYHETVLRMETKMDKLTMQIADVDRKVERLLGYKEGRRNGNP